MFLGSVLCLSAQTPLPGTPPKLPGDQNKTPVPQPTVTMTMEDPSTGKMPAVPPDTVVLQVGDFKLTAQQFDQLIDILPEQMRTVARGSGRKQFGDNLARMLVLAQEAKRRKLDETPAAQVQALFQMNNVLAGLMYQQITKETKADEADLRKFYADHKTEFEQVSARHILVRFQGSPVPVKPGQKDLTADEALAKALELETKIKAGADFSKLATDESDDAGTAVKGGDLGFFRHGAMVPSFEQAAFAMNAGQVSEPVKSQFGYHIIKVEAVKSFDDVKADVEKRMAPEMATKAMEELQKKSSVVYNTEFFNMTKQ
jgi:parvulin-like peptidyl-prolyl isomerase